VPVENTRSPFLLRSDARAMVYLLYRLPHP
jgi:hypothetical protein